MDNCSITQIAENYVSHDPDALLMLALFFQRHRRVLVSGEQEGYSLSLVSLGGRPEWNPAPKCYFPSKVKSMSHSWSSPWVISAGPLLRTISRMIKDRQARSTGSEDRAGGDAKRDFPSLSKHPATSPSLWGAINCGGER